MEELFQSMRKKYNEKLSYTIEKTDKDINNRIYDCNFISKTMQDKIMKEYKNTFVINIHNTVIYVVNKTAKIDKKLIDKIVRRIHSFGGDYNIFIWLLDDKKKLPKKKEIISKEHVNSGCCIDKNIYLWRKEELLKVLLHEMIHSRGLDKHLYNADNVIMDVFNVKDNVNINESYTELMATVFNSIFYTIENKKSYKHFLKIMQTETEHSMEQIHKILHHYDYENLNELYRANSKKIFPQKTNVFSYYIVKGFLLNNYGLVIEPNADVIRIIMRSFPNEMEVKRVKDKGMRMTVYG